MNLAIIISLLALLTVLFIYVRQSIKSKMQAKGVVQDTLDKYKVLIGTLSTLILIGWLNVPQSEYDMLFGHLGDTVRILDLIVGLVGELIAVIIPIGIWIKRNL